MTGDEELVRGRPHAAAVPAALSLEEAYLLFAEHDPAPAAFTAVARSTPR